MIAGGREVPAARTKLHRRGRRYHIFQVQRWGRLKRRKKEVMAGGTAGHAGASLCESCPLLILQPSALNRGCLPRFRPWHTYDLITFTKLLYVLLTVHPHMIFYKWSQLGAHYFVVCLFQLLYMFRATTCPSSGELTVSMRHWYFSLCMGGCLVCSSQPADHTASRTEWKIPVSQRYSKFSWRWAHSCPKHVEKLK